MFSIDELRKLDLYFKRPAKELIFLTIAEHRKIHRETSSKYGKINGKIQGKKNVESGWIASLGKIYGKKSAKPIIQCTKAGELIREWESALDVQRQLGINNGNISRCCNGRRKSAGGFVWKYK